MISEKENMELFIEYYSKHEHAYRERVHFFEEHQQHFQNLEMRFWQDIVIDYHLCLFAIGRYERFLESVDDVIEMVIIDNVYEYSGKDIYVELLYRKTAAMYNIQYFDDAFHISKQLIRMKNTPQSRLLYSKCAREILRPRYQWMKAVGIITMIIALAIGFSALIIFKPFYSEYVAFISQIQLLLCIIGVLLIICSEVLIIVNAQWMKR